MLLQNQNLNETRNHREVLEICSSPDVETVGNELVEHMTRTYKTESTQSERAEMQQTNVTCKESPLGLV